MSTGKWINSKTNAKTPIDTILLRAKVLPIFRYPISIKGILKTNNRSGKDIWVNLFIKSEIPVTPPSKKPFGIRKHSSPIEASAIPMVINDMLRNIRFALVD